MSKEPSTSFTASKNTVVTGEVINFTNTTVDGFIFEWNFGDGTTSTLENPTHSYEDTGTYNVQLTSFSKNGKKSSSSTLTITVAKANEIKYDGNKYPLTKGYLLKYGDFDYFNYFNFDVYLVNDGITITQNDEIGNGDYICLELWSSSSTGLNPGTYSFTSYYDVPQTFSNGVVGFNYNIAQELGMRYECSGGFVIISQSGTDYIFDITFTLANGKTVNAYYKGPMIYYDRTDYYKNKKYSDK